MLNRRDFLKQAGAVASVALVPPQPRPRDKLDLQLNTVRAAMRQDLDGTLKRIAGIGYEELETYGFDRKPRAITPSTRGRSRSGSTTSTSRLRADTRT